MKAEGTAASAAALQFGRRRRRVPMLLQTEDGECGLACLAMVAAAHGLDTDLAAVRARFAVSLKGTTLADLVRCAELLQLHARALRAELDEIAQLATPCILHWDLRHFVVLVAFERGVATVHDPAHGVRRYTLEELSPHFTGVALELAPAPGFTPRSERRSVRIAELLGPVSGLRGGLAQIVVLALALEGFVLLSPFFMQWVVDDVLVSADRDLLLTLGVGFALLVVIQAATAAARAWAVLVLSANLALQWLLNVYAHLLKLPVAWFEKRHAGDVWSRFASVQQIQKALTTSFVEALLDGVMVLATLAMMCLFSLQLTAVSLVAVVLYALLRRVLLPAQRAAAEEALVHESRQTSHFLESLRGVVAIRLHNAQAERRARYGGLVVDAMNADLATRKLDLVYAVAQRLLFGAERVAVIWLGALLVLDHRFSVGMLFAFFAYKEQFALRVGALVDKAVALKMLRLHGERLADIVLTAPEAEGGEAGAAPRAGAAAIELDGVVFRYADGERDVLAGVSFAVAPGESVAIVGPSGCGKTTLVKLLLGLHAPNAGEVRIGGVPLARYGLRRWRDEVGVVMQDEPLFAGSVADNICFFDPAPDMAWLQQCAKLAAVHDEIEAMPMGYHTLIGELGAALSGGQKQRIVLARALYRRPRVLLLDEATSALDVERERAVVHAVRQLALTRIVIAHRPETIASAGRVIALHEGRVAQDLRSVTVPAGVA